MSNPYFEKVKGVDGTMYDVRDPSKAPLDSPELTGVPTAPTASEGTNSTQIATTEFVKNALPTYSYDSTDSVLTISY